MAVNFLFFICIFCSFSSFVSAESFKEGIKIEVEKKKSLQLITGMPKPPFIFSEQSEVEANVFGEGIQRDLISAAFENDLPEHQTIKFIPIPLARNITVFQQYSADGVITLPSDYHHPALFNSKPYIDYQNVVVSLKESDFTINKVADLSGKSIAAFQKAKKFLGEKYRDAVAFSLDYREVANQEKQIELLFLRRTEAIVLDINIFKYFIKNNIGGIYNKAFIVHYIFAPRHYVAGFRSKEVRDKFDKNIEKMRADGSYQAILDNYLK